MAREREKGGLRIRSRKVASGTAVSNSTIRWHDCVYFGLQVVADIVWDITGTVAVITGGQEEGHSDGRHDGRRGDIRCRAFDLATRNLNATSEVIEHVLIPLFEVALGPAWNIINEGDHFHFGYAEVEHWQKHLPPVAP